MILFYLFIITLCAGCENSHGTKMPPPKDHLRTEKDKNRKVFRTEEEAARELRRIFNGL